MSVSTVVRLKGNIPAKSIADFLEKKFGMQCQDLTNMHSTVVGPDITVYEDYSGSGTWDAIYGHIAYKKENEKSSVFYSYCNLNFHENYEYYQREYPELIPMVEAETTYVSHYCCDEGKTIIRALAEEFGGWYSENDCDGGAELIIGRIEKEQVFDSVDFAKRDAMISRRVDIMTDIETLGRGSNPPVFQISAVQFDIETGDIINTFNVIADVNKMKNIEGGTLLWWLNENKELLTNLLNEGSKNGFTEEDVISKFVQWISECVAKTENATEKDVYLWGNGILFDNRIIKEKCDSFGIKYPIYYRNDRDVRTICELAAIKTGFESEYAYRNSFPNVGNKHDGFDDARFQVKVLAKAYKVVCGKE